MNCENCDQPHDGVYGSGRFCCRKCARAFSTKNKRKDINERVSKKLKGKPSHAKGKPGKKHTEDTKARIISSLKRFYQEHPERCTTDAEKRANNVYKVTAYRARQRKAIPENADLGLIKRIYESCPPGYHVDHIHSLATGGLHHQDNLQYLPGPENCRKCADREYDVSLAIPWKTLVEVN